MGSTIWDVPAMLRRLRRSGLFGLRKGRSLTEAKDMLEKIHLGEGYEGDCVGLGWEANSSCDSQMRTNHCLHGWGQQAVSCLFA